MGSQVCLSLPAASLPPGAIHMVLSAPPCLGALKAEEGASLPHLSYKGNTAFPSKVLKFGKAPLPYYFSCYLHKLNNNLHLGTPAGCPSFLQR